MSLVHLDTHARRPRDGLPKAFHGTRFCRLKCTIQSAFVAPDIFRAAQRCLCVVICGLKRDDVRGRRSRRLYTGKSTRKGATHIRTWSDQRDHFRKARLKARTCWGVFYVLTVLCQRKIFLCFLRVGGNNGKYNRCKAVILLVFFILWPCPLNW